MSSLILITVNNARLGIPASIRQLITLFLRDMHNLTDFILHYVRQGKERRVQVLVNIALISTAPLPTSMAILMVLKKSL